MNMLRAYTPPKNLHKIYKRWSLAKISPLIINEAQRASLFNSLNLTIFRLFFLHSNFQEASETNWKSNTECWLIESTKLGY